MPVTHSLRFAFYHSLPVLSVCKQICTYICTYISIAINIVLTFKSPFYNVNNYQRDTTISNLGASFITFEMLQILHHM